jgi:RNA polymerase sigma factor (sigma-70 family)
VAGGTITSSGGVEVDAESWNFIGPAGHNEGMSSPLAAMTDVELLDAARDRDPHAFGVLFRRHADAVYNYCYRRIGSWSDAEDATSLVFLETWRNREKARTLDDSLRPWLLGVATNVLRNQKRAERRYDAALYRLAATSTSAQASPDPAELYPARQEFAYAVDQLNSMQRAEREVVALVLLAELSYVEVASALAIPIGTVRSRYSRALRKLRLQPQALRESGPTIERDCDSADSASNLEGNRQ